MSTRSLLRYVCAALLIVSGVALRAPAQQNQQIVQGVYLDADGVLKSVRLLPRPDLVRGREPRLTEDVRRPSAQRKVSLTRLEKELARVLGTGATVPEEMQYLAGLHRIDYVVVLPEFGEVIVVGPAEGWIVLNDGTAIATRSRQTVLRLDDLIVALRAFPPGCDPDKSVWCSIDPTEEGRIRLQQALANVGRQVNRRSIGALARTLQEAMGPHKVVVSGVPVETGIAFKMVGADYAMKAIAMGVVQPRVRGLRSYVEMVPLTRAGSVRMQRWWFIPADDLLQVDDTHTVWKLNARRVQLVGESDFQIRTSGEPSPVLQPDPWNRRFAEQFTREFDTLKQRVPVLDELENVFELLTMAVIVEHGGVGELAGWQREEFLDTDLYRPLTYPTPRYAETLVNVRIQGTRVTTPVGGARYQGRQVLSDSSESEVPAPPLQLPDDPSRWWWD